MHPLSVYPVEKIISTFRIGADTFSYHPFGSGHINDTYLVEVNTSPSDKYLLQRINHQVFKDVEGLMQNMQLVTSHLRQKLSHGQDGHFTTVTLIPTLGGKWHHQDEKGNYWRMQTFIPNSISYDTVSSEHQAFQAGYAFGKFQLLLRDIPIENLKESIPDFHNMEYRFRNFASALEKDPVGRKASVKDEVHFALDRKQSMLDLYAHVKKQEVPLRITHNDTKFNNVLLDQDSQQAICVIDLDTVMPGVVWYDFGDSVRTIINTAEEDEATLDKIEVNLSLFDAFTRGYLQETSSLLTDLEVEQMAFSSHYMTFIMGLRFLTDYLEGDVYYKTKHLHHNLQRAKAQFNLVSKMEAQAEKMKDIVRQTHKRNINHLLPGK
ncbi:phosphotransferase enzyme family protein [Catalinimonas niigatensis]|uniref:phosphotransferase enzyme family protein n=1 Tax=Catalinimonas niigatensis TaxID=1397264 RepID=UPI0026653A9D|nr:aminoglycoside phosphotransferase family protein [Catalinimonas niigatensis]WPP51485.1 aminoglycoside phosphotransferase family protein [Catalinimonas niigatensis]